MLIIIINNIISSIPTWPSRWTAFDRSCAQYKDKAPESGDGLKLFAAWAEMASDGCGSCLSREGSGEDSQVAVESVQKRASTDGSQRDSVTRPSDLICSVSNFALQIY